MRGADLNTNTQTRTRKAGAWDNDVSKHNGQVRCAIYTRKSTEEGLDQDFNTLDAQRESGENHISSMKHEGWVCLPRHYDDGGFTGGNMERPALKRLMADVEAGEIDVVVVYKVDRLSRSLLDFSRMIETFEQHNVSFVSVTQQFSTTNSMGRLTLNILLSFAQFEREIISERTRDKMSAARKRGKWVGGMLVLGYDRDEKGGRIMVNKPEAERVRAIFELYLNLQSLIPVVQELNERGWKTKQWITKKDKVHGGKLFTKPYLYSLLTNIIYIGKLIYQGAIYEGEHEGIVAPEIWHKVQELFKKNGRGKGANVRNKHGALLRGLLQCVPCGKPMMHTYTIKKGGRRRYRYYVCMNAQQRGWNSCPSKSLNAHEIERAVVEHIRGLGSNEQLVAETVRQVREQGEKRWQELNREREAEEKDLKQLHSKLRQLAGEINLGQGNGSPVAARLADLQDRIRSAEQRMTQLREELLAVERESLDQDDLAQALAIFDPVWESLNSREQSRIMHLLLDQVGYDGSTGKVTISFKSPGIKELARGRAEE